jgi:hypothetical protein
VVADEFDAFSVCALRVEFGDWRAATEGAIPMKLLFAMSLVGALIGGFPGALLAFSLVISAYVESSHVETICFCVNIILAIGGAFAGMLYEKMFRERPGIRRFEILVPGFLGILCGIAGYYYWFDWVIRDADY